MASFSKTIFVGRLTADPELKQTAIGTSVCAFSIAVDRFPKKDGDPDCDYFNIVAWRERAEFIARYFRKGQQILLVGKLQNRSWTDKAGNKRYITELIVEEANFVDGKKDDTTAAPGYNPYTNSAATSAEFEEVVDEPLPF